LNSRFYEVYIHAETAIKQEFREHFLSAVRRRPLSPVLSVRMKWLLCSIGEWLNLYEMNVSSLILEGELLQSFSVS